MAAVGGRERTGSFGVQNDDCRRSTCLSSDDLAQLGCPADAPGDGVFRKLDLAGYVADKHNEGLLLRAWKEATGAETVPAAIYIKPYFEGHVGELIERTYSVRYWKPAER